MRHLNYSHLHYFWTVAREGSIAKASELLHITPQTISGQLKLLEESIGEPLFQRAGRGLSLTAMGDVVNLYADEIFTLGGELAQRVQSQSIEVHNKLSVGILNSIPKLIAFRTIAPALELEESIKVICQEGEFETLLGDLAVHKLDLIISDRQVPAGLNVKAYNHKLGNSQIAFFAHKSIASRYSKKFPQSLTNAPLLLPASNNQMRRDLDDWFDEVGVQPNIVAEVDDSALIKAFGEAAIGLFPAPYAVAEAIESMYHAKLVGTIESVTETYYTISPERKIKHPGVLKITEEARSRLFN
ncbi:MAG: transcriptional activator NhaR [Gammaproteobacteria bacterium]|nr:transcriptional activator NhaR [Gammaproteobacteria bacterium]